jgi:hypothetical protein
MLVGTLGSSVSSVFGGAGFSASGMMLLNFIDELKNRTAVPLRVMGCDAAVALAVQLAGDWARRGARMARRRAALLILVAGLISIDVVYVYLCVW